jgi:hypothetical protein
MLDSQNGVCVLRASNNKPELYGKVEPLGVSGEKTVQTITSQSKHSGGQGYKESIFEVSDSETIRMQ